MNLSNAFRLPARDSNPRSEQTCEPNHASAPPISRKRPACLTRAKQHGNTLAGFLVGLLVGLALAVAVALFVTKTPVPSVSKAGRTPSDNGAPSGGRLPDPNASLYSKEQPPAPPPAQPAAPSEPQAAAPAENNSSAKDAPTFEQSFLQAGAFKSNSDAENLQARLALLGLEAKMSTMTRDGDTLYRVRVGPYARPEDLARVRERLTENGISPTVVPVGR